jgi:hypothetical protein
VITFVTNALQSSTSPDYQYGRPGRSPRKVH